MKTGEMKVYYGESVVAGNWVPVIIAATSQRAAVAALANFAIGISVRHLNTYWKMTSNREQCEIALTQPGQAFAASSLGANDFAPLPRRELPPTTPAAPKVPKDREGRKEYDRATRADSDAAKRARGERRITTWLPKEAAEALDKLTDGSAERGAVQAALTQALLELAARRATKKAA